MTPGDEIILPIGSQKQDPAWQHCFLIQADNRVQIKCKYCSKYFLGGGIHRIKEHLARMKGNAASCPHVPTEVQQAMQQNLESCDAKRKRKMKVGDEITGKPGIEITASEVDDGPKKRKRVKRPAQQLSMSGTSMLSVASTVTGSASANDRAYMAIARFLYEAGVPLDVAGSAYFRPMIEAVASVGPGFVPPSYHDFRGLLLKRSVEEVNAKLEWYKEAWARTGCSILVDEWTTQTGQTLINFLVYCPEGMMFLKSVEASNIVTPVSALYELLKLVVEEVGVRNVVQVITKNTECHVVAGKWLTETFPTVFWSPCASRCTDAVLEELGRVEWISEIVDHAKSITGFIYNHGVILNLMKKYTNGKELILPTESASAMNFITLKRIFDLRDELIAMVTSQEWMESTYAMSLTGAAVAGMICGSSFWSSSNIIVRLSEPLVQLSRIVEGIEKPAMDYAYAGMSLVKGAIKKELVNEIDYMPYLDIIDRKWDKLLHHPLHTAGFFLNPRYFYNIQVMPKEISSGMLECIEKLVPDIKIQDKINKELILYKNASGDFGRQIAVRGRDTLSPAEWWSNYGGSCPNLARLAVRILSQTCSARTSKQNHIPFEKIHYQRLNNLERQRLYDLIYVQYNLRLQQRKNAKSKPFDPISLDNINIVDDWVIENSEMLSEVNENFGWMVLDQPIADGVLSHHQSDENAEISVAEFRNEVIGGASLDSEDVLLQQDGGF